MKDTTLRRAQPHVYVWPTAYASDVLDLSRDCVAYEVSRSTGGPMGSWSLDLLPRTSPGLDPTSPASLRRLAELYRQIDPMDLVSIGHQEPGGMMLGLVSNVSWATTLVGGAPAMTLRINGADLGKLLVQDNITRSTIATPNADFATKIDAALGPGNPVTKGFAAVFAAGNRDTVPPFVNGSVQDVIDWILAAAPSLTIPVLRNLPAFGSGRLADVIRTIGVTTWNNQRCYHRGLEHYQGSVRGFIEQTLDMDFYETWVDFIPATTMLPEPVLIVRPKPFDEPGVLDFAPVREDTGVSWQALTTLVDELPEHVIEWGQVHSFQLGRSDADAAAFFQVTSLNELIGNAQTEAEGLNLPLVDTFAAKRIGMRSYKAHLSLLAGDIGAKIAGELDVSALASEGQEFRNRLFNWHRLQPWFETGSVTVPSLDRYRPGDPVLLPWAIPCRGSEIGLRFYCPSVTWRWQMGGPPTATLQLVRGHNASLVEALKAEIAADAPPESPDHYAAM